jgi:hypothetical protein
LAEWRIHVDRQLHYAKQICSGVNGLDVIGVVRQGADVDVYLGAPPQAENGCSMKAVIG